MNFKTAVFGLFMTVSMGTQGAWTSGGQLLEACEKEDFFSKGDCFGYISGTLDSYEMAAGRKGFTIRHCIPEGVTKGQMKKIVMKYLNENPEKLHFTASSLVLTGLREAFPCEYNE
jgi:hypothetical protein